MKNSLIILGFFVIGIVVGKLKFLPYIMLNNDMSVYALYFLLFFIGIVIGMDKKSFELIRKSSITLFLIPFGVIIGSLLGGALTSLIIKSLSIKQGMAISAGLGYYSLSSILIAEICNKTLGVLALLSNIFRELITLTLTPIFVRLFGPLSPIASAGATAMDTTLPIITKFSGKEYAILAIFSGLTLTILIPFIVSLFCYL